MKNPLDYQFKSLPTTAALVEFEVANQIEFNTIRKIFTKGDHVNSDISNELKNRLKIMAKQLYEIESPIVLTWGTNGNCGREGRWFDEITLKYGFIYKSVNCDCIIRNIPEYVKEFNGVTYELLSSKNSGDWQKEIEDEISAKKQLVVFTDVQLRRMKDVSLCCRELVDFPQSVCGLKKVESLVFNINKLSHVLPCISGLKSLNYLSFHSNEFTTIPLEIFDLTNLVHLDFSSNKLTHIPEGIERLTKLETLILANNELNSLPDGISLLTNLNYIDVRGNHISIEDLKEFKKKLPNTKIFNGSYIEI
jgi:Leucine-rich repeat (LRR) protein